MKLPQILNRPSKKLGSRGMAHHLLPALVVVGVAAVGTYMLVASHADTAPQLLYCTWNYGSTSTSTRIYTVMPGSVPKYIAAPFSTCSDESITWGAGGANVFYLEQNDITSISSSGTRKKVLVQNTSGASANDRYLAITYNKATNKLAYMVDRPVNISTSTIFVKTMNLDGTGQKTLASFAGYSTQTPLSLQWSPDGKHISYTVDLQTYGTTPTKIINRTASLDASTGLSTKVFNKSMDITAYNEFFNQSHHGAWSSDSTNLIGVHSAVYQTDNVWKWNLASKAFTPYSPSHQVQAVAFSPIGSKMAFFQDPFSTNGNYETLTVANPDGTVPKVIYSSTPTNSGGWDPTLDWSPSGAQIAFTVNGILRTVNKDGTGLSNVIAGNAAGTVKVGGLSWSAQ